MNKLIIDSGSSKTIWCFLENNQPSFFYTAGLNPYFLSTEMMTEIVSNEILSNLKGKAINELYFYGAGVKNTANYAKLLHIFQTFFPNTFIEINTDMLAAARGLCGREEGVVCILGTGSNACFYDGKEIIYNTNALGFILGDEGGGVDMGKKVLQHYLYKTFDEDLLFAFKTKYNYSTEEILERVYKGNLPNKFLAQFSVFLAENRGHFIIENIIEDSLNNFVITHLYKMKESWTYPIYFMGSIADIFKDVLIQICSNYELQVATITKTPIKGLIRFHEPEPTP